MKQDPMTEWQLRDELLAAFHRWPLIVAFAIAGTLLGLVFAYFWPSTYHATAELSVELNPYRVLDDQYIPEFSSVEFRNIDDYKHWQMLQLSIVVLSDPYMQETLNRLKERDASWSSVDVQELRGLLEANWRNAGLWVLGADADTSNMATQAVETWREVILDLTAESISNSRELFKLELILRSLNNDLVENQIKQAELEAIQISLKDISDGLNNAQRDETEEEADRLNLFSLAKQLAALMPDEGWILEDFPKEDATVSEFLTWIEKVNLTINTQLDSLKLAKSAIDDEIVQVSSEWEMGIEKGQGLSATLSLENLQGEEIEVKQQRSYGLMALIGMIFGLLMWILVFLIQVTRKGYL
jgi:hypothetical protein